MRGWRAGVSVLELGAGVDLGSGVLGLAGVGQLGVLGPGVSATVPPGGVEDAFLRLGPGMSSVAVVPTPGTGDEYSMGSKSSSQALLVGLSSSLSLLAA